MKNDIAKIIDHFWAESNYNFDRNKAVDDIYNHFQKEIVSHMIVSMENKIMNDLRDEAHSVLIPRLVDKYMAMFLKAPIAIHEMDIESILRIVCIHYDVAIEDVKGKKRTPRNVMSARKVFCYVSKTLLMVEKEELILKEIGTVINVGYCLVIYHYDSVVQKMNKNPKFAIDMNNLVDSIRSPRK